MGTSMYSTPNLFWYIEQRHIQITNRKQQWAHWSRRRLIKKQTPYPFAILAKRPAPCPKSIAMCGICVNIPGEIGFGLCVISQWGSLGIFPCHSVFGSKSVFIFNKWTTLYLVHSTCDASASTVKPRSAMQIELTALIWKMHLWSLIVTFDWLDFLIHFEFPLIFWSLLSSGLAFTVPKAHTFELENLKGKSFPPQLTFILVGIIIWPKLNHVQVCVLDFCYKFVVATKYKCKPYENSFRKL